MFQVVNRSFQIMQKQMEDGWRRMSDLVIVPEVRGIEWDEFASAMQLIEAGERAAEAALPQIQAWLAAENALAAPAQNGNARLYHQEDCALKKS